MYNKLKLIFKNYSIRSKLKRTFVSILGLTIFLMLVVICVVLFISSRTNSLYDGPYKISENISDIRVNLQTIKMDMFRAIAETDPGVRNAYLEQADTESTALANNMETLKVIFKNDSSLVDEFLSSVKNSEEKRAKLSDLLKSNANQSIMKVSQDTYSLQIKVAQDSILKLFE
ncbi:MAG: methyl-accepting chemotaxis protein, partial [Clostridium sp.]|nr:methyl-accepting chemotaxis protein [Clostridium sp.]